MTWYITEKLQNLKKKLVQVDFEFYTTLLNDFVTKYRYHCSRDDFSVLQLNFNDERYDK